MGLFDLFSKKKKKIDDGKESFGLVTIVGNDNFDLRDEEFKYLAEHGNLGVEYVYSMEDMKEILPMLQVTSLPWFLIIKDEGETQEKILHEMMKTPLLSTGNIQEVHDFLAKQINNL